MVASIEGPVANAHHAGRDIDAGQVAEAEGIVADARHASTDINRLDIVTKTIPGLISIRVILHGSFAKDGEGFVGAVVRPIYIVAAGATGLYNIFVCCPVAGCLIGLCGACRHVDVSEFVAIFEYIVAQRGRGGKLHEDRR